MTLNEFMTIWRESEKHIVYLCFDDEYVSMFDLTDKISDGEMKIEDIREFFICAFIPWCSQFVTSDYLKDNFADAEVKHFYIGDGYMIVWIEEVEE